MSTVIEKLITAEEFAQLPHDGKRRELVRGEVVEQMPPGGLHADIAAELSMRLRAWAKPGKRGCVAQEAGFILARDPDVVRSPDVYFVRRDRLPVSGLPLAFWHQAPDLAVEVISPSESAEDVQRKVREYLAAGTSLVWVIYPQAREVLVYRQDGSLSRLGVSGVLQDADLLPEFTCPVGELFAS